MFISTPVINKPSRLCVYRHSNEKGDPDRGQTSIHKTIPPLYLAVDPFGQHPRDALPALVRCVPQDALHDELLVFGSRCVCVCVVRTLVCLRSMDGIDADDECTYARMDGCIRYDCISYIHTHMHTPGHIHKTDRTEPRTPIQHTQIHPQQTDRTEPRTSGRAPQMPTTVSLGRYKSATSTTAPPSSSSSVGLREGGGLPVPSSPLLVVVEGEREGSGGVGVRFSSPSSPL